MIKVGDTFQFEKKILEKQVLQFAKLTGDFNPVHIKKGVVHGMLVASLTSRLVGMELSNSTLWLEQHFRFVSPALIGDRLIFFAEILQVSLATKCVKIRIIVRKNKTQTVVLGDGTVMLNYGK